MGLVVRLTLLPRADISGDIDLFVSWVHGIARNGLPSAYDAKLTFPPVTTYIWWLLAAVEPDFQTATDSSDQTVRILMKVPATLADLGLAGLVAYALRHRPRWAVAGAAAILLHPAVIDVSAWMGQYESIYLLFALAAAILATRGRNGWAAALIAFSLMTKPQALALLVPFAALFWATGGWRGLVRAASIGAAVIVILWLPFVAADGPANYLRNVAHYQGQGHAALSVWAWNIWWLVQEFAVGGFAYDSVAIVGPLTFKHLGFLATAFLGSFIAVAVIRDPRPRTFVLALAASVLVAFSFATSMHERYSYGALIFLLLLLPEPRMRWVNVSLGVVVTLNLLASVPPTAEIDSVVRASRLLGVLGSLAMLGITGVVYTMLRRTAPHVAAPSTRGPPGHRASAG
ncbi:MAG TPA: glycosyltransferase 87 family protein [Candidatus Limnocylindria bacterium]|nr:glycosyltransferase 87 family protein [Candidatus Limnocylindria bacterium]